MTRSAQDLVHQQLATTYSYPAQDISPRPGRYGARTTLALARAHAFWRARTAGWETNRQEQLADLSRFLDHAVGIDESLAAAFDEGQRR